MARARSHADSRHLNALDRMPRANVFVSTPDLRPSLLSVLEGLVSNGLLARLATTISFSSRSMQRVANTPVAGRWLAPRLGRTEAPAFLSGKIDNIWHREMIRRIVARAGTATMTHEVWEWAETNFDRVVAKRYGGLFDVVYGMEHSSAQTFAAQKESGGLCILRQVNSHARTLNTLLRQQCERFPNLVTSYHRLLLAGAHKTAQRKEAEYAHADLIVANSDYVRETFMANGISGTKIVAVPTGCPPVDSVGARSGVGSDSLRVLYVGSLSLRKGFPYLLEAWRRFAPCKTAELWIAGGPEVDLGSAQRCDPSIRYLGVLTKDDLREVYRKADLLVLPTLSEGLAHVVLEGLSFGLPIVTTEASGAGDLVRDGENGFIVPERDAEALAAAIEFAAAQRSSLPAMGARSKERAQSWTVAHSNAAHLTAVQDFLAARGLE